MQRIKEEFLNKLEDVVRLRGLDVLEVGCGNGSRTEQIAQRCKHVIGIEPNETLTEIANDRGISNALFQVGSGEKLNFDNNQFDIVIFTLSLHHIPTSSMMDAISEAVRVVKPNGHIVFLEPTEVGSFFETELQFDASDGDERAEKKAAYTAMLGHLKLKPVAEIDDETIFQFDSTEDFILTMEPKKKS